MENADEREIFPEDKEIRETVKESESLLKRWNQRLEPWIHKALRRQLILIILTSLNWETLFSPNARIDTLYREKLSLILYTWENLEQIWFYEDQRNILKLLENQSEGNEVKETIEE